MQTSDLNHIPAGITLLMPFGIIGIKSPWLRPSGSMEKSTDSCMRSSDATVLLAMKPVDRFKSFLRTELEKRHAPAICPFLPKPSPLSFAVSKPGKPDRSLPEGWESVHQPSQDPFASLHLQWSVRRHNTASPRKWKRVR